MKQFEIRCETCGTTLSLPSPEQPRRIAIGEVEDESLCIQCMCGNTVVIPEIDEDFDFEPAYVPKFIPERRLQPMSIVQGALLVICGFAFGIAIMHWDNK